MARIAHPVALYPALAQVRPSLDELSPGLVPMSVPTGTVLFSENAPCQGFPLVLAGEVKVSRNSGDGRSLELYRVVPGELCLVSSACLFRTQPMTAHGVTTKPTTLLLIEPGAACAYEAALRPVPQPTASVAPDPLLHAPTPSGLALPSPPPSTAAAHHVTPPPARSRSFHGAAEVTAATSKMRLVQLAEEIIAVLSSDPNATVKVVLEISAEFPHGATDPVKRAVSENARSLGMKTADWE